MLPTFFACTYILSWLWFWVAAYLLGRIDSSPTGAGSFLFLPGVFVPAFVAIALTARSEGRAGIRELLSGLVQWRVSFWYYAFALLFMIAIKLSSVLIYKIAFGAPPSFTALPWYFMAVAVLVSTPFQAGEEIGWRGFALPRLAKRFGLPMASVILGLIWAVWHLPFFYISGSDNAGQSFPVYLIAVTAISVAMAWLYWKTNQSLLLAMLMHASIDNTAAIVTSRSTANVSNPFMLPNATFPWITAAVLCLAAVFFLIQMQNRRRKLPRLSLPIF